MHKISNFSDYREVQKSSGERKKHGIGIFSPMRVSI
jgi:hypothetical protein